MTNSELKNKICEGYRGERGQCKNCDGLDFCLIGKEVNRRGLQE